VSGPEAGLLALEELDLAAYHPYHAARADFLARLGRDDEARAAYDTAIGLTENEAEREALARQRDALMS
jgi:RNA polymerase sigma-70 factor (ECF subfamily)